MHLIMFIEDGKLRVGLARQIPLEDILRAYEVYTPELLDFLQSMLRIRAQDRLSARELLSHAWILSVAPDEPSV